MLVFFEARAEMWAFMKEWCKAGCPTTATSRPTY
jgi:hypothetical protein